VVRAVLAGRLALKMPHRGGHLAEVVRRERHVVVTTELDRRARLSDLELDQLVHVGFDEIGELVQDRHPFGDP